MKNHYWSKLKIWMMLLAVAGVIYSCSTESILEDSPEKDLQNTQNIKDHVLNSQMRIVSAMSCAEDCIESNGSIFYPVSDMATLSVGINTKSVSYEVYNTETDFVVEVTYAITAGPSKAKATITIYIDGKKVEYTSVSSGSTVIHSVPLASDWAGCDVVEFSILEEALGVPISFNESYGLIPVCSEREVGMEYQGGIIAYIFQSGDPGYVENEIHGIIAAPSDQSIRIQWYNGIHTTTGATGTALGTGQENTTAIVNNQGAGSYAAQVCFDLILNGYEDWFLPSKDELDKLFQNKVAVGGFASAAYLSSSEYINSYGYVWAIEFGFEYHYTQNKDSWARVRAIRAF